jgi:hypothetical protein
LYGANFYTIKFIEMSNIKEDEMIDLAYKIQVLLLSGEDVARNGYDLANELVGHWIAEHKIQVI